MKPSLKADIDKWLVQMRKGAAEFAVLSLLRQGRSYGSRLLDSVADAKRLNLSEGSIYPLLKRLEYDDKIASSWEHDEGAIHPRKYYELTDKGLILLDAMSREWIEFSRALDALQAPASGAPLSKAG
jgi:PadR family transcriptional regulator PadR